MSPRQRRPEDDRRPSRTGKLALLAAMVAVHWNCIGAEITLRLDTACTSCDLRPKPVVLQPQPKQPAAPPSLRETAPCTFPEPVAPMSVAEAMERSLCHDPRVRETWAQVLAQRATVGMESAAFLPEVGAELSAVQATDTFRIRGVAGQQEVRATGLEGSLGFSWLLYDFGRRDATVEKARQILAAVEATRDASLQTVLLDTAQRYYGSLNAQATLDLRQQALAAALDIQKTAEARYRAGVGPKLDLLQAKTAASQAAVARAKAEGELRGAMGALALGMGLKVNAPLVLEKALPGRPDADHARSIDELIEAAYERNPGLRTARAQLMAARQNVAAAKAEGLPSLSLRANLARNSQRSTAGMTDAPSGNSVQLSISIPIYEGSIRSHRVQNALAQADARAAEVKAGEEQVALETWHAYQAVQLEAGNMKAAETLVGDARQAFEIARGRYRAGVGSMQDVLTAQVALAEAEQLKIQSVMQWRVARLKMAAALGNLGRDADY